VHIKAQNAHSASGNVHFVQIMRFSDKLLALMIQSGDTQESLGKAVGVAHTTVGRWLAGVRPRTRIVAQLSAHFGVAVEILLDDDAVFPAQTQRGQSASSPTDKRSSAGAQLVEKWRSLPKDERVKIADKIIDCLSKNIKE
jgi:transcriptional regulator with XRE-family HTH domain